MSIVSNKDVENLQNLQTWLLDIRPQFYTVSLERLLIKLGLTNQVEAHMASTIYWIRKTLAERDPK